MLRFNFPLRLCMSLVFALAVADNPVEAKPILAFSIAQGWSNDFVGRATTPEGNAAIEKMIDVLQVYHRAGYPAYPIINPQNKNKDKVVYLLDRLTSRNVPFILSVITSECLPWSLNGTIFELGVDGKPLLDSSTGKKIPVNVAASAHTGMPLWDYTGTDTTNKMTIQYYLSRYPKLVDQNGQGSGMVGFRIMEPEWIVQQYKSLGWGIGNARTWLARFTSIAQNKGLFVQYNTTAWDHHYLPDTYTNLNPAYVPPVVNPEDPENEEYRLFRPVLTKDVGDYTRDTATYLTATYSGVVYLTYATNDTTNTTRLFSPLIPWRTLVKTSPIPGSEMRVDRTGVLGVGLSIQSWMSGTKERVTPSDPAPFEYYSPTYMPYSFLVDFVNDAQSITSPAAFIQFESNWYFFNQNETAQDGTATLSHAAIAWALIGPPNPMTNAPSGVVLPYYYDHWDKVLTATVKDTSGVYRHGRAWPSNGMLRGGFATFYYWGNDGSIYSEGNDLILPGQPGTPGTPVYPTGYYWNPNFNTRQPSPTAAQNIITPIRLFDTWPPNAKLQSIPQKTVSTTLDASREFRFMGIDPAHPNGHYTFKNTNGVITELVKISD